MCSEYVLLTTLTVSTEHTTRQLFLTVRYSAAVLDMTGFVGSETVRALFF